MVYEPYRAALKRLQAPFDQAAHWRKIAKTLKLSKQACTRLEWIIYYRFTADDNASLTCRHFGIARKVFYTWLNRFDESNLRTLEDLSKAPKKTRQKEITPRVEARIVNLRKEHIRWGKMKLKRLYLNVYGEKISSWKIQYTIKKYNLYYHPLKNERLQQKRKRSQKKKRITELKKQPFTGYLIALDVIVIYWNGLKRYILTAIDTVSKIPFARMYTTKSSCNTADFLRRFFYLLDDSVLNALHDNGSEFHKEFIEACQDLGIAQYWSRNHTPTDNSINERFNRTLQDEFIALGNFNPDPVQFNQKLTEWLIEFTFVRPHEALGYDTPWQFYQKINKVLPMYPSRTQT
ncbi:MAG: integrase core domain-containing protein [Ignavibacteria bacterium]|nr:integrase core domain-containing protein [Ignavibacteria bacterium]